jgi:hypothetical protein
MAHIIASSATRMPAFGASVRAISPLMSQLIASSASCS